MSELSPYEFMAREFDRLAILRKMWNAAEVAAIIRRHDIPTPGQLDAYTIERCAEVADNGCTHSGCDPQTTGHSNLCPAGIAAAIRALGKGER